MHRPKDQWHARDQRQKRKPGNRDMNRDDEPHGLAQIIIDPPPQPHSGGNGFKIIVQKNDRRGFAGHIGPSPAHGDADMRRLQGWRVVDAIAGHRNNIARSLQRLHNPQLLFGHDPGKNGRLLHLLMKGRGIKRCEILTGQDMAVVKARLACNRPCGLRIIPRDHHNAQASRSAQPHRGWHGSAHGVCQTDQSLEHKFKVTVRGGQGLAVRPPRLGNAQNPQAMGRHIVHLHAQRRQCCIRHMAQLRDRLGRAFGRNDMIICIRMAPDMRHRQKVRMQRIMVPQRPARALALAQLRVQTIIADRMKGLLHRVHGLLGTGHDAQFHERKEIRRQRQGTRRGAHYAAIRQAQLRHAHPVFRQGTGLVGAQDGGGPQGFDGRLPSRQHAGLRHPHRPHRHENRQHNREFFRQHRHAKRNARQRRIEPTAPQHAIEQNENHAGDPTQRGHPDHQAPRLDVQARRIGLDRG